MARLIGRTGAVAGKDFVLTDNVRLGAAAESDIRIAVDGVSRRHARIFREAEHFWLEDVGATNGTFLNGARIVRESLHHLDVVTLGRAVDLIFLCREDEPLPSPEVDQLSDVKLEILDGPEGGTIIEVPRGEITLGRALSCNVVISSPAVGRAHARIERSATRLILEDLQSANGTEVNGKRIDGSKVLVSGDIISLAGVRSVSVRFSGQSAPPLPEGEVALNDSRRFNQEWKTRFVWAPEELAQLESSRADAMARAKLRDSDVSDGQAPAKRPAAAAPAPAAAAPKPASAAAGPVGKVASGAPAAPVAKASVPAAKPAAAVAPKPPAAAVAPAAASAAKPPAAAGAKPGAAVAPPAAARPASPAAPAVKVAPPVAADAPPQSSVQPAPSAITPVAAPPKPLTPFTPLLPAAASDAVPIETKPAPSTAPDARSAPNAPVAPPQVPVTGTSDTAKLTQDDVTTRTVRPIFQIQGVRLIGPAGTIRVGLGTFKIGRAVDADVRLEDRQVSRAHALLFVEELSIAIEDLKTVNGTLVNGREIKGRQQIKAGDVVHVGDSTLKVEVI